MKRRNAICLFSSAGLGELGLVRNGVEIIASNELLKDRHDLYQANFPRTKCFLGDIRELKEEIVEFYSENYSDDELFMVYATPPCQGMSTNGVGRLKHEIRVGNRSEIDERNRLVLPAMEVITRLRPKWVVFFPCRNGKDRIARHRESPAISFSK